MARNIFTDIATFFGDIGRANEAAELYRRLDALSDDQLRARGLQRGGALVSAAMKRAGLR